ncbi:MAG TPA: translocation/assembly module TamB domain-containing protein [Arachidicoccus sp.]|nr:translocation/assembly module TamB domain-containing protein [Arachidicoccus sp.]
MRKALRIVVKTILWIIGALIFIIVLLVILIQVTAVQNFLRKKTVTYLENKIHTKVEIGSIRLVIPKSIEVNGVYFEDQHRDTLLYSQSLLAKIDMWKLLKKQLVISEIAWQGVTANVIKDRDSIYNFDYILQAFAGDTTAVTDTSTGSSFKIALDKINFDRISLGYRDSISQLYVQFYLGHFDTRVKTFDLDKMRFNVPNLHINNVIAKIEQAGQVQEEELVADSATAPLNMDLAIGQVDLSRIHLDYLSQEMNFGLNLGQLLLDFKKIDLPGQSIDMRGIDLNNTTATVLLRKPATIQKAIVETARHIDTLITPPQVQSLPWTLSIAAINLAKNHIKFDNELMQPVAKGLDYGHMDITDFGAHLSTLRYAGDSLQGQIRSLRMRDKSGFAVDSLQTSFFYGPSRAYARDLYLQLPHTLIKKYIEITYPSLEAVTNNVGLLGIHADIENSQLGVQDILMIAPFLSSYPSISNFSNSVLRVNAKVSGRVGDLKISKFDVSGLGQTNIKAAGTLQGLPDPNKTYMNLVMSDFNTTRGDLLKLTPPNTLPTAVSLPARLHATGSFKGMMDQFQTSLNVRSTDGAATLNGLVDMRRTDQEIYSADVKATALDLGKILKMPDMLGKFTLQTNIKGKSFNPKKASLQMKGSLQEGVIKGYAYQNLVFDAKADQGKYQAVASMADPNIHFQLDADADMTGKAPAMNAVLNIDSIDLHKLHLTADSLRFHGKVVANIPTADPDSLNAIVDATHLLLVNGSRRISVDTIHLESTAQPDSSTLLLTAPDLGFYVQMAGQYKLTKLGPAFQALFNRYFTLDSLPRALALADSLRLTEQNAVATSKAKKAGTTKRTVDSISAQHLQFSAAVYKTPKLAVFVPELKQLDTIRLAGTFDSKQPLLDIEGQIPAVIYGTDSLENGVIKVHADEQQLTYFAGMQRIAVGSAIQLHQPSLSGSAGNNKLTANLVVKDAAGKDYYKIGALAGLSGSQYRLRLLPDSLLLDYQPWKVSPDNYIQYDSTGMLIHHFNISDAGQELNVQSEPELPNGPIGVGFKNFKIETLTKIANQDSIPVGGLLNGTVKLDSVMTNPLFTAAVQVKDLNFRTDTIGDISLNVDNKIADTYQVNMQMTGKGNQLALTGAYHTAPQSYMDFALNVGKLNLKSIEGLTFGYLKNMGGSLDGGLKITGTTDKPEVNGKLHFNQAAFNVAMLNAAFSLPDENVSFDPRGIGFNKVNLYDSNHNRATIDGRINTTDFLNYGFGLTLNARDFQVINSTRTDNPLYYGKLYINARMNVNGDMDKPIVDGTIGVGAKTDLTVVLPTADPSIEDREGVVQFVQKNQKPNLDSILVEQQLDSLRHSEVKGMDLSATIDIDKNALFTILIDERNGDVVKLRGEAHLNAGIDPSGQTSLTGTYEVNDGSYNLSYATVKRKFNFKKGSTIVWTGDPTSANVDLTAVYVANVPPIDLVENQLASSENTIQYKQKLPFNVELMMKNQLLEPDISFDISLPDDNSQVNVSSEVTNNVNTRLAQIRTDPNEMNKQVLGVLVLGHFIGDNPLESMGGGITVEGAIRNSVSSLLSDQLNRLADNLISGVDLDFGLTSGEDYSSGTATNRTDLNVGISKNFLNDRLTVSVGNNFNLEGAQQGEKATNIAGNVSANYKLSRDGRYMLRAYRKDRFIVIQGQIIETGLGFSLTLDYNRFKEILQGKSARQKEWRRRFKARQKAEKAAEQQQEQKLENSTDPKGKPADEQPADPTGKLP